MWPDLAADNDAVTQLIGDLRSAGLHDAHHVIQDAAGFRSVQGGRDSAGSLRLHLN